MNIEHRVYQVWGTGQILPDLRKEIPIRHSLAGPTHWCVLGRQAPQAQAPASCSFLSVTQLPQRLGCGITSILNNANAITIEAHSPGEGREIGI